MLYSARNKVYYLFALCFVILLIPIFLRGIYDNKLLIGGESFNSVRFAEYVHDNHGLPKEDSLSYGVRPYFREYGLPILFSLKPYTFARWLPLIFGLLSFIFFYKIVSKISFKINYLASLLFITSPAFIYLFSTATKYTVAVFLSLLGLYLYMEGREKWAMFIFSILGFFSYVISIFILIIYLLYTLSNKKWNQFLFLLGVNIITFLLQFHKIFTLGLPETFFGFVNRNFDELLRLLFSDFGGKNGISIFLFILGFVGVYFMWKERYKYLVVYFVLSLLIILSLYFNFLVYYVAMLISIFAAYAFMQLNEYDWRSKTFKFLTILIICCGLLFSSLSYIDRITKFTPTKGFGEGLEFLKEQNITTTVFSHYTRGSYLSYTGKRNFMDDNFLYAPNVDGRYRDMWRLFRSKDINEANAMINKYGIQYIWIDTELREELYGKTEKEFLFLLRYSPQSFKKVFNNDDVEIYKYEPVNLTQVQV